MTGNAATQSAEETVRRRVCSSTDPTQIVELLEESAELYRGLSPRGVDQIRAYLLAHFATAGLPSTALPAVLEELESGSSPESVAAAARALHGTNELIPGVEGLLRDALRRMRPVDRPVDFTRPSVGGQQTTTATAEINSVLERIARTGRGDRPSCCGSNAAVTKATATCDNRIPDDEQFETRQSGDLTPCARPAHLDRRTARSILEDQDGRTFSYSQAFCAQPTAVAFFYTRCDNPQKCSLTVTKLGQLAHALHNDRQAQGARVAGITLDPEYDSPRRLKTYGCDRGLRFDEGCSLYRTVASPEPVFEFLDVGVGYGGATVNRHRLDFLVLDADGLPVFESRRRLWSIDAAREAITSIS